MVANGRRYDPRCRGLSHSPTYPNTFGHGSFLEAVAGLDQVWYISELQCSRSASLFLCSVFFPPAAGLPASTSEVCLQVQGDCRSALKHWPRMLSCSRFLPKDSNQIINPQTRELSRQHRTTHCTVTSSSLCSAGNLTHNAQFFTMISFGAIPNCTQPCRGVYFSDQQLTFLHYWTVIWSSVCLASCFIVLVVYIICYRYIRHPEAPIFYIALCYIGICLAYLLSKLTDRNDLLCDNRFNNSHGEYALVSNIFDKPLCTMVFSAHYYFTLATWSWWLVLTVEWLGVSVTDRYISWKWQILSHLLGWGLPIPFLSVAVGTRAATGNSLLQLCWFSSQQNGGRGLLVFFILPLTAVILCCSLLLLSGFLINSCNLTQRQHKNRSTTVPLLSLSRTSIFSTLFLVVNGLLLSCNLYELFLHSEWENHYLQTLLHTRNQDCHQPMLTMASRPSFPVVLTLVASSIVTGVVLLFWIPRKELLCCCRRRAAVVMELNNSISERPKQSVNTSITEQYSNDSSILNDQ